MNLNPNDVINDRFKLVRTIGRGSFGEVWLANDQKLGLNVAIKIYIALDTRGLEEFKSEFKSVYNIHHPNLLRSDYFDNIGDNPYLVMPYCPISVGPNVGKMTEEEIWRFIKGVASGLQYLHENDIIHRDIKPDNILKDEQGNYVITDFGLSTKLRSTLRKASARQMSASSNQSGTIGYMAPEMFTSKPNAVKATDIWALGATIFEVATGEMPFCGQGGVMELHGAELPELPTSYSKELNNLIDKCLSKDTWDRPTAEQIANIAALRLGLIPPLLFDESQYVKKEDYDNEVSNLLKTISIEKEGKELLLSQLKTHTAQNKNKKTKAWAITASLISVALFIFIFGLKSSINSLQDDLQSTLKELSRSNSEIRELKHNQTILDNLMKINPILATEIKVRNKGEDYDKAIYSSNTTYINPKVTLVSNKDLTNQTINVKFYDSNGRLRTGDGSSGGYSYKFDYPVSLSRYEPKTIEIQGWGGSTKGHWNPGNYRIEIWMNGNCVGTKHFNIY